MIRFLLALALITSSLQALGAPQCKKLFSLANSSSYFSTLKGHKVYNGATGAGKILRLNKEEYEKMAAEGTIDPDTILVLSEISGKVDPPFVAGIILSQALPSRGSHIEILCKKLGVPLVHIKNAYSMETFKDLEASGKNTQLSIAPTIIKVTNKDVSLTKTLNTRISAMPEKADRTPRGLFEGLRAAKYTINQFEEKFLGLAYARGVLPKKVTPDITVLLSGEWEAFKKTKYKNTQFSLEQIIDHVYRELATENNQSVIRQNLDFIRDAILTSTPNESFFRNIYDSIVKHYGARISPKTRLSIRSNNDIEDLLGAGLYESAVAKTTTPSEIERAIRVVWASMYSYKAFTIRRHFGLREDRLSMPLLIHPFIGNEKFNGVASIKLKDGELTMSVNLVEGSKERATNPGQGATVHRVEIKGSKNNPGIMTVEHSSGENLHPQIYSAIKQLFTHAQSLFIDLTNKKSLPPERIDLEWTAVGAKGDKVNTIILQFKDVLNSEQIADVLSGKLSRDNLYPPLKGSSQSKNDLNLDTFMKRAQLEPLETYLSDSRNIAWSMGEIIRYTLVLVQGKPRILLWLTDKHHSQMKEAIEYRFKSDQVAWKFSGYLNIRESSPNFNFLDLKFELGQEKGVDPPIKTERLKELFREAFSESSMGPLLPEWRIKIEIEDNTFFSLD